MALRRVLVPFVLAVLILVLLYSAHRRERIYRQRLPIVQKEFNSIQAVVPSTLTSCMPLWHFMVQVAITCGYRSPLSFDAIQQHYAIELAKNGWVTVGERTVWIRGEYYGAHEVAYRKNHYTASLFYAGDDAKRGWNYSFALAWPD